MNSPALLIFILFVCEQVQLLQQQVTSLADTQSTSDDRYARAKADNAVLQARVHMLEEHVREVPKFQRLLIQTHLSSGI